MKSRWLSKTYWLGTGVTVLGAVQSNFSALQQFLSPKVGGILLFVVGVLVMLAREATTEPLKPIVKDGTSKDDGS